MLQVLCGFVTGGGLATIALALLNRKWAKDDKGDAIVAAVKLIMLDRYTFLAKQHIAEGRISLQDKSFMDEVFLSYKALGGNGHLDGTKAVVDRLPVVGD